MRRNNIKAIYRKLGGLDAFQTVLNRIAEARGVKGIALNELRDENEKPFALAILFAYDNAVEGFAEHQTAFKEAFEDVARILDAMTDLHMSYECNGDGDHCTLMNYRLV